MPAFLQRKLIRFQHCDPAGLIFYPRVFELGGEVIEDWFLEWAGRTPHAFHTIERRSLPTVKTACEFLDQVRVSDELDFALRVTDVGRSSIAVAIDATRGGTLCFRIRSTLVQVGLGEDGRYEALAFTAAVRERLLGYRDGVSDGPTGGSD